MKIQADLRSSLEAESSPSKYSRSRRETALVKKVNGRDGGTWGRAGCGPGLWLRWQKNRYDVFMRTARVCQADGIAIAARRISGEKHRNSCVSLEARPDLFSITFLRLLVSRILPVSSPRPLRRILSSLHPPSPCRNKIRFDVNLSTDISSQRHRQNAGPFSLPFFTTSAFIVHKARWCMNFVYKLPIAFFSSTRPG